MRKAALQDVSRHVHPVVWRLNVDGGSEHGKKHTRNLSVCHQRVKKQPPPKHRCKWYHARRAAATDIPHAHGPNGVAGSTRRQDNATVWLHACSSQPQVGRAISLEVVRDDETTINQRQQPTTTNDEDGRTNKDNDNDDQRRRPTTTQVIDNDNDGDDGDNGDHNDQRRRTTNDERRTTNDERRTTNDERRRRTNERTNERTNDRMRPRGSIVSLPTQWLI